MEKEKKSSQVSHSTADPQAAAFWKLRKEPKPCIKPANNSLVLEEWVWPVRNVTFYSGSKTMGQNNLRRVTMKRIG